MPGPGQGPAGYFQLKPGHALLLSVLVCWQSEAQQGQQQGELAPFQAHDRHGELHGAPA